MGRRAGMSDGKPVREETWYSQFLKERIPHSFLGWYIPSWLLWNWAVMVYLCVTQNPAAERISWVRAHLFGPADGTWAAWKTGFGTFGMPVVSAILIPLLGSVLSGVSIYCLGLVARFRERAIISEEKRKRNLNIEVQSIRNGTDYRGGEYLKLEEQCRRLRGELETAQRELSETKELVASAERFGKEMSLEVERLNKAFGIQAKRNEKEMLEAQHILKHLASYMEAAIRNLKEERKSPVVDGVVNSLLISLDEPRAREQFAKAERDLAPRGKSDA
jgi:hypothetical protein